MFSNMRKFTHIFIYIYASLNVYTFEFRIQNAMRVTIYSKIITIFKKKRFMCLVLNLDAKKNVTVKNK